MASQPSTCTSQGNNLDACPIRILLEVVENVVSCEVTVQGSFLCKCSQLSWCRALNVKVMVTFYRYFLSSLFARLWWLPWCPAFGCWWTVGASRGATAPRAPWTIGLSVSHPRTSNRIFAWTSVVFKSDLLGLCLCVRL